MNDCLLALDFARELMEFVLQHQPMAVWSRKYSFEENSLEGPPLKCVHGVGKSVLNLMLLRSQIIYDCYRELSTTDSHQDSELGKLVLKSVPHYFPDGYTHDGFVAFCGMAIGVSAYYLLLSDRGLFSYMIGVVGNVLTGFMLTGEFGDLGGWNGLECVCKLFNADSRRKLNLMTAEEFQIRCYFVLQMEIDREELGD